MLFLITPLPNPFLLGKRQLTINLRDETSIRLIRLERLVRPEHTVSQKPVFMDTYLSLSVTTEFRICMIVWANRCPPVKRQNINGTYRNQANKQQM